MCFHTVILYNRGAHSMKVIVAGNEHGDRSSNPNQGCLHFT